MSDITLFSVIQPDARIDGYSQVELAEQWWRTIIAISPDQNPAFFDDSNSEGVEDLSEKAALASFDSIQFLAGAFGTGTIERTITIPGGSSLFIPLINISYIGVDFVTGTLESDDEDDIDDRIRPYLTSLVNQMEPISFTIDGVSVPDLLDHRQVSKDISEIVIPTDNAFGIPVELPPEVETWQLAGGYWIGLLPLSPEDHRITFAAISDDPATEGVDFTLDVTYNISFDLNEIVGNRYDNRRSVRGTNGWDEIRGLGGNDYIVGGGGNDVLYGGSGSDTLIGTTPYGCRPGCGEIDILYGGGGRDTFVLGDRHSTFYRGRGMTDYAIIKDFSGNDTIRLHGSRCQYQLREDYTLGGRSGTAIFRGRCELIGFIEDATNLSLRSNDFSFTGC